MAKNSFTSSSAGKANGPSASKTLKSPSSTPAEQLQSLGGMPPEKTETGKNGINETNSPKRVPGTAGF